MICQPNLNQTSLTKVVVKIGFWVETIHVSVTQCEPNRMNCHQLVVQNGKLARHICPTNESASNCR